MSYAEIFRFLFIERLFYLNFALAQVLFCLCLQCNGFIIEKLKTR